jgi:HAD superfamily hydrolase (TIGR01509 family)
VDWVSAFDFFLFDFDGLLVDTERLHYTAYQKMLEAQGFELKWDFDFYCSLAHFDDQAVKKALFALFPALLKTPWEELYRLKKQLYGELLSSSKISLMPGVFELLEKLKKLKKKSCVVTNSAREQVVVILSKEEMGPLKTISFWITREDYAKAKPAPDGYLKALELYSKPEQRAVGFEDSLRGFKALEKTRALSVLICPAGHPQMKMAARDILHFTSFFEVNNKLLPGKGL